MGYVNRCKGFPGKPRITNAIGQVVLGEVVIPAAGSISLFWVNSTYINLLLNQARYNTIYSFSYVYSCAISFYAYELQSYDVFFFYRKAFCFILLWLTIHIFFSGFPLQDLAFSQAPRPTNNWQ